MSADRDGLLRAILDHPDDDTPRLVYADWLEEHGDAKQAHFIRTQIGLGRVPAYHPLRIRLWHSSERDLVTGGLPWRSALPKGALPAGVRVDTYRRGFPWQVATNDLRAFIEAAPALFALYPVQALKYPAGATVPSPDLSPLTGSPWLARLCHLEIMLARLPPAEIVKLQQSSYG
jgi:uncharacterized protein (TIGR02996 family)